MSASRPPSLRQSSNGTDSRELRGQHGKQGALHTRCWWWQRPLVHMTGSTVGATASSSCAWAAYVCCLCASAWLCRNLHDAPSVSLAHHKLPHVNIHLSVCRCVCVCRPATPGSLSPSRRFPHRATLTRCTWMMTCASARGTRAQYSWHAGQSSSSSSSHSSRRTCRLTGRLGHGEHSTAQHSIAYHSRVDQPSSGVACCLGSHRTGGRRVMGWGAGQQQLNSKGRLRIGLGR